MRDLIREQIEKERFLMLLEMCIKDISKTRFNFDFFVIFPNDEIRDYFHGQPNVVSISSYKGHLAANVYFIIPPVYDENYYFEVGRETQEQVREIFDDYGLYHIFIHIHVRDTKISLNPNAYNISVSGKEYGISLSDVVDKINL